MNTLEIAALSMQADVGRLGTVSQNLANVSTPGYKRLIDVQAPFADLLQSPAGATPAASVAVDVAAGSVRKTGQPLDVVVDGGAFLELRSDRNEPCYVRGGSFRLDATGRVVAPSGEALQLVAGDLKLSGGAHDVLIDESGAVHAGGELLGQLRLVRFDAPQKMAALGEGRWRPGAARITDDGAAVAVKPGYIEASNVQSTQEMVRLLETTRHFEALQKVVQGYDDALGSAIRKLGEV